ncbi:hypothetical protein ACFFLM_22835 [Deinococcus oregonensis]|uniref:Uncharacterized protein n=1 Tax=Deinococcus oregonensis TaxID=1805970 RepID=A0ABV6B4W3_9DEIO
MGLAGLAGLRRQPEQRVLTSTNAQR